jgi:DNA invertase Pin-like site-specific DNA recombinase
VSTEEQRIGPKAQREAIEAWAAREGIEVVGWHEDHGVSGKAPPGKRPALTEALAELHERQAGVLVVAKRDRLARDVMIAGYVELKVTQAGARIVSVAGEGTGDDSPTEKLMRNIIDSFAEYERGVIAARTRAALQSKKSRGERVGTVPFGYSATDDGKLVRDDYEQQLLERVKELREDGESIRGIVRVLAEEGFRSRTGRCVSRGSVENMLRVLTDAA